MTLDRSEERRDLAGPGKSQTNKNPKREEQREDSPFEDDEDFDEDDEDMIEDEE